jgi:hypothetical protein
MRLVANLVVSLMMICLSPGTSDAAKAPRLKPEVSAYRSIAWERAPRRTFYASPSGRGDGRSRGSSRGFIKLLPSLRPGDRVVLLAGVYPGARLSLNGTASRPIRIEAEHPVVRDRTLSVTGTNNVIFRNSGLQLRNSSYLRIKGLSFEAQSGRSGNGIEVLSGHDLAFTQNRFLQSTNYGLSMFGKKQTDIRDVLVEGNVFRNKITDNEPGGIGGVRTDYGLRIHGTKTLVARNNLFDGYFNHALSVKEKAADILIERNRFNICGRICIEAGQEPDTAVGSRLIDRTAANVNIRNNRFDGRNDGTTGVFARNAERVYVTGNAFSRINRPLHIANNHLNSRSCQRQLQVLGRKLAICENGSRLALTARKNLAVLFEKNRITGNAAIYVAGRGYKGDFLSIRFTTASSRVPVIQRRFLIDSAPVNRWTGRIETFAAPRVFIEGSDRFYVRD